jgi:hypothetical protein
MSNKVVDRSSILLGMGDVFVLDAASGNYSSNTAISMKTNLLGKMENVRIHSKKTQRVTKQIVNGIVHDDEPVLEGIEFYLEFELLEHNAKTQAAVFGGALTDTALALGSLMKSPKKLRFEVKFTYPIGTKYMWYIFPRCASVSELDFSPTNSDGHKMKAVFRVLPATVENAIWYTTTTPCFHNYIV